MAVYLYSLVFLALFVPFNILSLSVILFILFSFSFIKSYPFAIQNKMVASLLTLFFLYLLSLLQGDPYNKGFERLGVKLGLLLFPVSIAATQLHISEIDKKAIFRNFISIQSLSYILFWGVSIYQVFTHQDIYKRYTNGDIESSYLFYSGFSDWLMHPAYLSLFIGASMILLYFKGKILFSKKIFWAHMIVHVLYLFQLQGRMNIIALILLAIIIAFVEFIKRFSLKKSLFYVSSICVSIFVFWQIIPSEIKGRFSEPLQLNYDIQSPTFDGFNGLTIRLAEWECALDAIRKAPFLGHGLGQSKEVLHQSFEEKGFVYGLKQGYNAHNQYLEIALATGWIGLLIFLGVCVVLFYQAYQSQNKAAIFVLIYILLCFSTESYLERQWGVHFFAFIIPFLFFYPTKAKT